MSDESTTKGGHTVILAHPDANSFNATVAATYCDAVRECGQRATVRDLYAMGFDPLLKREERPDRRGMQPAPDVCAELNALSGSDVIVLVYPIWFGMPPAMLKGYIDRVIGAGVTPQQVQQRAAQGPLTAGHLLTITTSGAPEAWLHQEGRMQSLREVTSLYLFRAFSMRSADHLHIGGVVEDLAQPVIDEHLFGVREKARVVCDRIAVERYGAAPRPSVFDGS